MALTQIPNGYISDAFEITKDGLTFKDALVMPQDQYDSLTAEQIEDMKQQRFDNWYALVTAVSEAPVEPQE